MDDHHFTYITKLKKKKTLFHVLLNWPNVKEDMNSDLPNKSFTHLNMPAS